MDTGAAAVGRVLAATAPGKMDQYSMGKQLEAAAAAEVDRYSMSKQSEAAAGWVLALAW